MPILPQPVNFSGKVHKELDLSAIANFEIDGETYLAIGSDESKQRVQLLKTHLVLTGFTFGMVQTGCMGAIADRRSHWPCFT